MRAAIGWGLSVGITERLDCVVEAGWARATSAVLCRRHFDWKCLDFDRVTCLSTTLPIRKLGIGQYAFKNSEI